MPSTKRKSAKKKAVPAAASEDAARPAIVVGIGASAGGLKSLLEMLAVLPEGTEMSVVVALHLDRRRPSQLPEVLARTCAMPVEEIKDGNPVVPGRVYVLPPGHDVNFAKGKFGLIMRERRAALDGAIDKMLHSLADVEGERAVGVILSGTGTDGSRGIQAIKAAQGLTFAEAHSSAQCYGMPGSALATGAVDFSLPPKAIAQKLIRHSRHPLRVPARPLQGLEKVQDLALRRIFQALKSQRKVDFTDYKPSTLRRRITRRMVLRKVDRLEEYAEILSHDSKEVDDLFRDLLINVTGFFRDKAVFQALSKEILPRLIDDKPDGAILRIWVPGCATGEEVYSIGICVHEVMTKLKRNLEVQIFGTDLSDWAITQARAGSYPPAAMKHVSAERQRRYFDRVNDQLHIRRTVREMCTFAQQNLCEDPPFSRMDLISCRNVLIYLGPSLQRKCVPLFYYALNPESYLLLGVSETIGSFAELFTLMDKKNKIYRKKTTPAAVAKHLKEINLSGRRWPAPPPAIKVPAKALAAPHEREGPDEIQAAADHLILTHFAPCGVVIDSRMQVWHFRGHTSPFLEHAPGVASLNILKMVRQSMAPDVSAAVHQCLKTGAGVRKECMITDVDGATRAVSIEAIPFTAGPSGEQWLLVMFEYVPVALSLPMPDDGEDAASVYAREVARLRAELAATKESLQSIIEEQEAANEEIKSANEEIESSNEELQSTNEELETAKEELQSTNEELSTVNEELNHRNQEISEINNDLHNLLSSIHIAIIMVDDNLTIRRTTPLAEKLFNIIPTDIGRKLTDINPNIDMPGLTPMIRAVIDSLAPCEETVFAADGQQYSLRVRPYRTRENVINGVVITLVDLYRPSKPAPPSDADG